MAEKINPFCEFLKAEVQINVTSELEENFDSFNRALTDASELALKQPLLEQQPQLLPNATAD